VHNAIEKGDLSVAAVLSGNRNFEGRVHPMAKMNYLASPPLCVAYALAGSLKVDMYKDPLGQDADGNDVYLKDIWPSNKEVRDTIAKYLTPEMYRKRYSNVEEGRRSGSRSRAVTVSSTIGIRARPVQHPLLFRRHDDEADAVKDVHGARRCSFSATRSRRTTSPPPDRSRRTARPANISSSTRYGRTCSTCTAAGAAIMR
jgi:aconitate hydratase